MQATARILILLSFIAVALLGCGGGGTDANNARPPTVDTDLDWDQGNWDELNWQ